MKFIPKKPEKIPFTQEGYQKILVEQQTLLSQRPEAVENLRKAREMGDLRENGYYKAARQRLSFLDARLRRLDRLVKQAIIVQKNTHGTVDIGSTVSLRDEIGAVFTFTVVGGYESNPTHGTISYLSPLGKSLMGHGVGDAVTVLSPSGKKVYTITNLS